MLLFLGLPNHFDRSISRSGDMLGSTHIDRLRGESMEVEIEVAGRGKGTVRIVCGVEDRPSIAT
jgi:hypothetical protein